MESNITCLEIDVREQSLDNLKAFLLESSENREWINNPNYEKKIADSNRNKVSKIVRYFEEKRVIEIPSGDSIILESISKYLPDDHPYACVKAVSSKGITYLIHIGSPEELGQIIPTKECNELTINIGAIDLSKDSLLASNMEWKYRYIPQKDLSNDSLSASNMEWKFRYIPKKILVQKLVN